MRTASVERNTAETKINLQINLDDMVSPCRINTGIGFFDHMLTALSKHGRFHLLLEAVGDLAVDAHHTVEDVGIVLGQAFKEALADKAKITRYGQAVVPMDESLAQATVDISGRSYLVFNATIPKVSLNGFDAELAEEFFRAFAMQAGITLHINLFYGSNVHHILEAIFKAVARALSAACQVDNSIQGVLSTKGVL